MKRWLVLALCWYIQDVAQLAMTQTMLAPEIFVMSVVWYAVSDVKEAWRWQTSALLGGLLMDFRWTGVPGLYGALFSAAVFAARWVWFQIPSANRQLFPYVAINTVMCVSLSFVRLLFWDSAVLSGRIFTILGVQWGLSAVVLALLCVFEVFSDED
ncbi:MAG: hypothetical protein SOZ52_02385 [Pyramidobacter sp.]|nr:hypothetical protein [Pyramidobacter sp.]